MVLMKNFNEEIGAESGVRSEHVRVRTKHL